MALYHWNNGSPRKAKVSGSGNRQKYTLPDGVVMTGKITADADLDLYNYVETGPTPGEYECAGSISYNADGDTITGARSVIDLPLDQAQSIAKQKVKAKRDAVMNGDVEFQAASGDPVYVVQTDGDSRRELTGAVVAANEDSLTVQGWRMADNEMVVMDIADFKAMALAVRNHVNACYERQASLEAEIDNAVDVDAIRTIDIEAGWPANPTPEGE